MNSEMKITFPDLACALRCIWKSYVWSDNSKI